MTPKDAGALRNPQIGTTSTAKTCTALMGQQRIKLCGQPLHGARVVSSAASSSKQYVASRSSQADTDTASTSSSQPQAQQLEIYIGRRAYRWLHKITQSRAYGVWLAAAYVACETVLLTIWALGDVTEIGLITPGMISESQRMMKVEAIEHIIWAGIAAQQLRPEGRRTWPLWTIKVYLTGVVGLMEVLCRHPPSAIASSDSSIQQSSQQSLGKCKKGGSASLLQNVDSSIKHLDYGNSSAKLLPSRARDEAAVRGEGTSDGHKRVASHMIDIDDTIVGSYGVTSGRKSRLAATVPQKATQAE